MQGEAQTDGLVREILKAGEPTVLQLSHSKHLIGYHCAGKVLYVPKIEKGKDGQMSMLKVYGLDDLESFPAGVWGIREPTEQWDGRQRMSGELYSIFQGDTR